MSETPRELLVWEEFVASDGYVFGSGVRSATEDEVRAAVVPLLDLEAAAKALRPYLAEDMPGWTAGWQDAVAKRAVYAALGLGEES